MNRRQFLRSLTATPAAFLVAKYGMPDKSEAPRLRHYDPALIEMTYFVDGRQEIYGELPWPEANS